MATVSLDRLTKRYDPVAAPAVDNVSLTVADGEFMVLLGPSGCGKSSVLRMIAGLEPITSGNVLIDGRVVNEVPAKDRDIAMVFQSYALYPHMTVHQNLAFGLRRRKVAAAAADARVRAVAEKLGLSAFLARKPHALSGGQRQRVALGRAIIRDPKVFLFDEPLSNLDAALRVSMRNELIRQQREIGTTTIYVTHDQVEAMTMGDRICIMDRGETIQIGKPLEVYASPANTFVARFLGNPPMNLLPASLAQGEEGSLGARIGGHFVELPRPLVEAAKVQGRDGLILGIRPEDLYEEAAPIPSDRARPLPGRVTAVEPLGAETLIVLEIAGVSQEIVARLGRECRLKLGDMVRITLDSAAIHIFETAGGRAIGKGAR